MMPTFKQVATCDFVKGSSILLWNDKWAYETLQETWPHLFSFAKNAAFETSDLTDLFHLHGSDESFPSYAAEFIAW
jgi:hypothetical protein